MTRRLDVSVPLRLRGVFAQWDEQHRPAQPATAWNLKPWRAALPAFEPFLADLPNPIDRAAVAAIAAAVEDEDSAVRGFVAAMVWGYGRVGYGPYRTARVLTENPHAADRLREAARRARRDGGPDAFAWLARNRLTWLGVSFATKYLFFCGGPEAVPALVLDRLVQGWLREHAEWAVRLDWNVGDYRRYVQLATDWGTELGVPAADIEYLMFADAVSQDPSSQWAAPAFTLTTTATTIRRPQRDQSPEQAAVLDALDDAAEAFAALPGPVPTHDQEDFEHGLRHCGGSSWLALPTRDASAPPKAL